MPYPLPLTRTEAYLAYKAGVIQQPDLKPSLIAPRNGIDAWLAYWTGLTHIYPVKNVGKNLFNVATAIDNHWLNYQTGKLINDSNPNVVSNFIEVTSGTTYTISGADDLRIDVWQYAAQDENTATARIVLLANQSHTFTPNTPWIRFAVGSGDAISVKNQFMLEAGSTATSFEPYTGEPLILQEEEAYIAYLSGVINEYPEKCLRRVGAYLRYLISARWGRPDHPLNREELYLSLLKTQVIPSGDPSSDIVIDGTAKAPFQDVKMYGDTRQTTYTGKNLLQFVPQSSQGMTVTYDAKTGLAHVSGTNSSSDGMWANICVRVECSIPAGTYTLSVTEAQSNLDFHIRLRYTDDSIGDFYIQRNNTSKTFEMPKDAKRVYIWYGGLTPTYSSVDFTVGIQLESGSSVTSFEPYVGGQPSPSPEYPQPIQTVTGEQTVTVVGKNLAQPLDAYTYSTNGSATITSQANGEVTFTTSSSSVSSGVYIYKTTGNNANLCPELLTAGYTVSFDAVASATCTLEFGVTGNHTTATISTTKQRVSVATATGAGMVFYNNSQNGATITISDIQVELGSTESAYTPYSKQTLPINLGNIELCKFGTYQDYIWKDGEDWKVHKATNRVRLGDKNWENYQNLTIYNANASVDFGIVNLGNPTLALVSNIFTASNNSSITWRCYYNGQNDHLNTYGDSTYLNRSASSAKQWLSDNNAELIYALATPTDTTITNQNLIDQLDALVNGGAENGTTYIKVNATDPNLPGLLYVEAPKYE